MDTTSLRLAKMTVQQLRKDDMVDLEEVLDRFQSLKTVDPNRTSAMYDTVETVERIEPQDPTAKEEFLLTTDQASVLLPRGEEVYILVL